MPRIFVAIAPPNDLAAALATLLPPGLAGLRVVEPGLLHITLAFVGAVPDDGVAAMATAVRAASLGCSAFELRIDGIGRFLVHGRVETVWAGIGGDAAALAGLAERIRAELTRRRIPFDPKPFRPHLTLGRLRRSSTEAEARAVAAATGAARVPAGLAFTARAVDVMESALSSKGPRYSRRARVALAADQGAR